MKNKNINYQKLFTVRNFIYLVLLLSTAWLIYFFYESYNPVRAELSQIQRIANEYKNKTGAFGVVLNPNDAKNCFAKETFVRLPEMTKILEAPEVENLSCVFKLATGSGVVEGWSITIVKGGRAFCEDSTGDRRETPGLTTTHLCKI